MAKDIRQLIEECKALVEQSEPFQKKMKAKHSRMKKRVIGHGGQKNTPPFTIKPSMKRSKSAPPIGEGNTKDTLHGGKGDYKSDSDFDPIELEKGIKHEFEHTGDKSIAKEIAKDHLSENPKYYSELKKAGIQEHIVKKGSKYCLMSKKTNKNLGCYPTKAGAKKREKQVQYFKHAK